MRRCFGGHLTLHVFGLSACPVPAPRTNQTRNLSSSTPGKPVHHSSQAPPFSPLITSTHANWFLSSVSLLSQSTHPSSFLRREEATQIPSRHDAPFRHHPYCRRRRARRPPCRFHPSPSGAATHPRRLSSSSCRRLEAHRRPDVLCWRCPEQGGG